MRPVFRRLAVLAGLAFCLGAGQDRQSRGDVAFAGVFSDRMVVQRDKPLAVWGTADPGETVVVEFAGQTESTVADDTGGWRVMLAPSAANATGQPLVARIGDAAPGPDHRVVKDVVVGDVWLLAGGGSCGRIVMHLPDPDAAAQAFEPEAFRLVRTAVVPPKTSTEPVPDVKLAWGVVGQGDPKRIPAEAAWLAKALAEREQVPVGVIALANPRPVECWMSPAALAATPDAKPILDFYAGDAWRGITTGSYDDRMRAWLEHNQKLPLNPLPKPKPDDDATLPQQEPASVWNGMVAAVTPLSLRGVVWHHGEDWQTQNRAQHQGRLLAALIPAWRQAFREPELPFAVVQLEPHRYATQIPGVGIDGRLAAELREAQREAAARAAAIFVTTIDLPADPPPAVLAERIAAAVTAGVAGTLSSGPRLAGSETKGNTVTLSFTDTAGGLTAKGGRLQGFAVAASPMRWVWADATIVGDTVVVSSPAVPTPEGVRYAWEDLPARGATLCDAAGRPANPFRTDSHPLVSEGKVTPDAAITRFNRRVNPAVEDPALPRVLIIGDSISGHYHERVRLLMEGRANIVGEAAPAARPDPQKGFWGSVSNRFYRTDSATRGDDLKTYLAESGPWDIVHFNIGIHVFAGAKPGDEKPYAEQLRQVVQTIRDSGAVCLFANSTGTVADNTIPRSPNYLTNCRAFNAAAEAVMRELGVPVTDLHGLIQPRIKELISGDLIHTTAEADQMMAELIASRLAETIAMLPPKPAAEPTTAAEAAKTKQAAEAEIAERYRAVVAGLSPEEQAWEEVLQEQLGGFYLPAHMRDKLAGRSNAWDFVQDDPALPRVLLIGDSVSRGYTQAVRRALAGRANVHRAPTNCGPTANGIRNLDRWLASAPGGQNWDVIHFNFGIHDRNTPVADYADRLERIVERLEQTGARLVWATTTPIPDSPTAKRSAASIVERNAAAAAIMAKHGVATDDLFAFITPHLAEVQPPDDVHFTGRGYELLGGQVAAAIAEQLPAADRR